MRIPSLKQVFLGFGATIATVATLGPIVSNIPGHLGNDKPSDFLDKDTLSSERVINPLWAPTAYLQGIDCDKSSFEVKDLSGEYVTYHEYDIDELKGEMEEFSSDFSIFKNEDGQVLIIFKAMDAKGFEDADVTFRDGVLDAFNQDSQFPVVDKAVQTLHDDPSVTSIESIGFAQGSGKVYHLAEHYKIQGTNISDTGTNYTSEHLEDCVISLDVPGTIHSFVNTGDYKPAHSISLGEANDWSWSEVYTPVETSWVEKIEELAFKSPGSDAPLSYEQQGIKISPLNSDGRVCDNPTMDHD